MFKTIITRIELNKNASKPTSLLPSPLARLQCNDRSTRLSFKN